MTKNISIVFIISLCCFLSSSVYATSVQEEIQRVASEAASLELGFSGYYVGKTLTAEQKTAADANRITKALKGTYKFKDGEVFVVAAEDNDIILGIYKEYPDIPIERLKGIVGGLMLEYGEPTSVAHSKLIYWSYNENGKISEDEFDFSRQSGGTQSLATVKFSSSESISTGDDIKEEGKENTAAPKTTSAYAIITSDPLSKLFLAKTEQTGKSEKK